VSEGHPDKVCDRISDAIVDAYLARDPEARVACETLATTNRVIVAGEVRGPQIGTQSIEDIVRRVVRDIGYEQDGFHWNRLSVESFLHAQSVDIARGVDAAQDKEEGAGDQGIMFGYACRDTSVLMPATLHYAHRILKLLSEARRSGAVHGLGPDAKSQITLRYRQDKPVCATQIVVSAQHTDPDLDSNGVRALIEPYVRQALPEDWITPDTVWHVNPTGKFVIGGPDGDCGLTGRKIIVDTYGGAAPHGGGAFSGKDPTKVDRSAAYMARYLAKNIVAAELAERCTIQLSYAIGIAEPLSVYIGLHGTGRISEEVLGDAIRSLVDLTPKGIRKHLSLNRPIYEQTAAYGHFGRSPTENGGFSWEKTDLVTDLLDAIKTPRVSKTYSCA
jgi:S-adenosylmethionine synthetase